MKWQGYSTWEPEETLADTAALEKWLVKEAGWSVKGSAGMEIEVDSRPKPHNSIPCGKQCTRTTEANSSKSIRTNRT